MGDIPRREDAARRQSPNLSRFAHCAGIYPRACTRDMTNMIGTIERERLPGAAMGGSGERESDLVGERSPACLRQDWRGVAEYSLVTGPLPPPNRPSHLYARRKANTPGTAGRQAGHGCIRIGLWASVMSGATFSSSRA